MTALFVINEGGERGYNALRLATALAGGGEIAVTVFLLGDGVHAAASGREVPPGERDLAWMLRRLGAGGTRILACGTCMDQRGLRDQDLIQEAARSTMDVLAGLSAESGKVLVF